MDKYSITLRLGYLSVRTHSPTNPKYGVLISEYCFDPECTIEVTILNKTLPRGLLTIKSNDEDGTWYFAHAFDELICEDGKTRNKLKVDPGYDFETRIITKAIL